MRSRKSLWRLTVSTTAEAEDAVGELLASLFASQTVTHRNTITGRTRVSLFCNSRNALKADLRKGLRRGLGLIRENGLDLGTGRVRVVRVKSEDWATSWKKHFKPWTAGRKLLVKPSWSQLAPLKNQAVMILDPGLSFGTGQHPTTRFCLNQLVRLRATRPTPSLLDIGTGSGILAIGAALLGYSPVRAFDFDPDCARVSQANARTNRVSKKLQIRTADLTRMPLRSAERYDVVCANLMHDLLIAERARILNRLEPSGALVLAGILVDQFPAVEAAYRLEGWRFIRGRTEGEWRSGLFRKMDS